MLDAEIEQAALVGDADAVLDVELGLLEGRRDLVLDDLDADPVADRLGALLEGLDPAQVEPLRGVELQRPPARLRLRAAEADADLLADLVREQADGLRPVEVAGELAQRLRHQPRLEADLDLAHLPLELDPRGQRGDRVDGDEVDRAGAGQDVDDLERLLAVVGLGDQQLVGVDADPPRVDGVDRMLGVDEGADAPAGLGLGDDVVDQRRLARGLRAEDLDDPALRHAADAEREVERDRPGRDRLDVHDGLAAELHDRAGAELALDLADGRLQGRVLGLGVLRAGLDRRRLGRFVCCHVQITFIRRICAAIRHPPGRCSEHPGIGVRNGRAPPGRHRTYVPSRWPPVERTAPPAAAGP